MAKLEEGAAVVLCMLIAVLIALWLFVLCVLDYLQILIGKGKGHGAEEFLMVLMWDSEALDAPPWAN